MQSRLISFLFLFYRMVLSPVIHALFGPSHGCRFEPSCSTYSEQAIRIHGAWRGGRLAVARILRCHPWGSSGFDPIPHAIPSQNPDQKGG